MYGTILVCFLNVVRIHTLKDQLSDIVQAFYIGFR